MKTLLLLFAIAYLIFQVQANPVVLGLADTIEPELKDDEGNALATVTCYGRKGICQRRDWACPSGYMWSESVNNCPYPHLNKCCVP
ncbi:hypothetical protein JD844_025726 [Phrynosoma platyrhinos]|uniref:Uncharacterized protein n=1 Tax=Phrynosoma platyrhinos TaxID=52577 RepID=A0ABQ7T0F7_PHRPL|nr:hypothetical protein JD844_025726 [Phrynosoma platyrhinos]